MKCLITWGDLSHPRLFFKWPLTSLSCGLDTGLALVTGEQREAWPRVRAARASALWPSFQGGRGQRERWQHLPVGLPGQCSAPAVLKGVLGLCLLPCVRGVGAGKEGAAGGGCHFERPLSSLFQKPKDWEITEDKKLQNI